MLDTLKVYTPDFTIKDRARVTVQPSTIDYETGESREVELFRDESGRQVRGSKAYVNSENYNLTIQPMQKSGVECFIQTSIPKVINGENYYPVSDQETRDAVKHIQGDLFSRGVSLNLNTCKVSRIDVFKNIQGNEVFGSYSPVLSLLRATRQHRRDYGTTFTWSNTQRELCVYDKLVEMQSRGVKVASYPENTIRFEYRLKNSRVCSREIGSSTVKELINNLDGVRGVYQDAMRSSIFNLEVESVEVLTGQELQSYFLAYSANYGSNWLSMLLRDYGAFRLSKLAGVETVKAVLSSVIKDRVKLWRSVKLFETAYRDFEIRGKSESTSKTLVDLYSEIRDKVLS